MLYFQWEIVGYPLQPLPLQSPVCGLGESHTKVSVYKQYNTVSCLCIFKVRTTITPQGLHAPQPNCIILNGD